MPPSLSAKGQGVKEVSVFVAGTASGVWKVVFAAGCVHFSPTMRAPFLLIALIWMGLVPLRICAQNPQGPLPMERKVPPLVQVRPEPRWGASFWIGGTQVLGFDAGSGMRRPFLYPLLGPAGLPLTRMGHPHDPESHSHHNSVWLSHHDVGGTDFWADNGGTIEVVQILRLEDGADRCALELRAEWKDKAGVALINEWRRIGLVVLGRGLWRIDVETQLSVIAGALTLGQTPFGLLGVRMAKSIGVADGGGRILNSEGGVNESGCFRKPARWVDYSGPVTAALDEGITLLDHPQNLHHPVEFHVRNDGWMGAATTFRAPFTLLPEQPLHLKYGLLVHSQHSGASEIEQEWQRFAQEPLRPLPAKRK